MAREGTDPRLVFTCATPGCEAAGQGFTDEPGLWCSLCLADLAGVYDMTGTFKTDDELRVAREALAPDPEQEQR